MSKKSWPNTQSTCEFGEAAKCHGENGDLGLRRWGSVIQVNSLVLLGLSMAPKQMGIILFLLYNEIIEMIPKNEIYESTLQIFMHDANRRDFMFLTR